MFVGAFVLSLVATVSSGPVTESFKDQFCTDPRTMQKHAAYTEWADAYSCTRHRCQPGGRNLAIYTVGCKRVEAPESAIECEEVVEDTNMQFPFCCTRLRCLVVVRGEVWTRVLGQPWETLPAAPWSHMYKMKKPPPANGSLLPKNVGPGPIYELAPESDAEGEKVLRASKKTTDRPDCNDDPKTVPVPDIVIALATDDDNKDQEKSNPRHKLRKNSPPLTLITDDEGSDKEHHQNDVEFEDVLMITEKAPESSDEKITDGVTRKSLTKLPSKVAWTEIPQKEWSEQEPGPQIDNELKEIGQPDVSDDEKGKPALQALVDAIGTRMRDIENVVQKMSEKVHHAKPGDVDVSLENRVLSDIEGIPLRSHHQNENKQPPVKDGSKPKQPNPDSDRYSRFSSRSRGSKYLHSGIDVSTEAPLFVDDAHVGNGYFSDASNNVLRRASSPKEPAQTYMAPVETRRKTHILSDSSGESKKHKKHAHKKKNKSHKKHHGRDKRKRFNRLSSTETDKNTVSLEDSSAIVSN